MSTKCTVLFDNNPNGVYYAGQMISGTAELVTTRPKTIRSIYITINGYAEVRWTETLRKANAEGKMENYDEPFAATEHYLTSQSYVYGQSQGGSIELPTGKYLFTFQGLIPPNGPTTLNGEYGQIRYEIIVTIDRPLRYDNVFKQPFTVISPLDLNLNPIYMNPCEKNEEKTFLCGFCCGNNDPIIVKANIPYNGYAPGQKINFHIAVDNKSNIDCSEIKIKLYKNVTFTCRTPNTKNRANTIKICDKKLEAIPKQEKREFTDYLQIPSTTPSTLKTCSIIEAMYHIEMIIKVSGLHTNIEMKFPITIGTVPLYVSANEQNGGGAAAVITQPGQPPIYNAIAPPSYEEDVNRTKLFKNNDEYNKFLKIVDFVPKYPVFYNAGQAQAGNGNHEQQPASNVYPPNPTSGYVLPNSPPPIVTPTPNPSSSSNNTIIAPAATSPPYPAGVIWDSGPTEGNTTNINPANSNSIGWRA